MCDDIGAVSASRYLPAKTHQICIVMPVGSIAVKKSSMVGGAVRKKSSRVTASLSGTLTAAGISTTAADTNARQVTRAEFMELSAVVAQLRKDLLRIQSVGIILKRVVLTLENRTHLFADVYHQKANLRVIWSS